jgi:hypothetical protein
MLTPYERIMRRTVEGPVVREELGPCLDCDAAPSSAGYPRIGVGGRAVYASRIVIEHTLGRPIQEGMCALHKCDRPSCVREHHLYEGTQKENYADALLRGRLSPDWPSRYKGSKHPNTTLNENAVRTIRDLVSQGYHQCDLARVYGITRSSICDLVGRKRWQHVA